MLDAIDEGPPGWRVAAGLAGLAAVWSSLDDRVPIAAGVALAALLPAVLVDVLVGRLPNRLVAMAALLGALALVLEVIVDGLPTNPADLVVGAIAMAGPLLIVHLLAPGAMGFGDVKTAMVAGAALGLVDPVLGLGALAIGSAGTAIVGATARRRSVAFGPGLVGGAIVVLVLFVAPIDLIGRSSAAPIVDSPAGTTSVRVR